jgi:pimeloyl-ACP methyl ester carboxylesterase
MGDVAVDSIIVAGDDSLTHSADFAGAQAARLPNAVVEMVPNATHFVPMEQPRLVAAIIADCVEQERR